MAAISSCPIGRYRAATITLVELLQVVHMSKQSSRGKGIFAHFTKSLVAGDCPIVLGEYGEERGWFVRVWVGAVCGHAADCWSYNS